MTSIQTVDSADELMATPPGEHRIYRIPVTTRSSGEPLNITVHAIRGTHPGPTLAVLGALHGDATFGPTVIRAAASGLDPTIMRGTVLLVSVANPIAFETGTRNTGQGWNTDMTNLNRVFPGTKEGWVTQQLAAALSDCVIAPADAVISYHCGTDTAIDYTLVVGDSTEQERHVFNFARLMCTSFIYVHAGYPYEGTLDGYAKSLGKLCLVAEQGGQTMPPGYSDLARRRLYNVMKGLGILPGEPEGAEQLVMRGQRTLLRAHSGGMFVPALSVTHLGQVLEGGHHLGDVVDAHTFEVVQELRAPYARTAVLQGRFVEARVNPGDYAFILADAEGAECLKASVGFESPIANSYE